MSPPLIIVGNKIDLEKHEVSQGAAEALAEDWSQKIQASVQYVQASAKTNISVDLVRKFNNLYKN